MLSFEQMSLEYAKSYSDKTRIYFIEHYLSTFNAMEGRLTPFSLFPRQKAFLRSLAEKKKSIAIKHRQAGITTITSAWATAQIVFAAKDSPETILCLGNKLDLAEQLVTKIREFLMQVPRWYWGDDYYSLDPKSEKNKKDIFTKNSKGEIILFNGCRVVARSSGPNAARGIPAVSILIFDEAAFIENGLEVYSSAVAATSSVPHAKIVMVSTPNGKDELYYNTYKQALSKENGYNAVEFKWFQDLRYNRNLSWYKKNKENGETEWIVEETLDENGTIRYDEERWRELERDGWTPTSPWYIEMCQSFNNDSMRIAQELDVSFMGSANNVVAPEFIEMQRALNVKDPLEDMKDPYVEETWFWKPPIEGHRYILGCDPSRGDAGDRTAIEVIDMDGRDENGMPILEQVMEYLGKKLGDEVGNLIYNYATMYNNAFVVVDATGGVGDACLLTLMQLGYKNIFYDDASLKKYTVQQSYSSFQIDYNDRLPGFHMQGNRFPMLSSFAGMVKNNEIKIRSIRVINELDTWIFKGEQGRMDHMSGAHDDSLTCLAMALFVMQYSFNKLESTKHKDAAILKSYMMGSSSVKPKVNSESSVSMTPKAGLPFYNNKTLNKYPTKIQGSYLWLFGGRK
jgi:hypothetical protein